MTRERYQYANLTYKLLSQYLVLKMLLNTNQPTFALSKAVYQQFISGAGKFILFHSQVFSGLQTKIIKIG